MGLSYGRKAAVTVSETSRGQSGVDTRRRLIWPRYVTNGRLLGRVRPPEATLLNNGPVAYARTLMFASYPGRASGRQRLANTYEGERLRTTRSPFRGRPKAGVPAIEMPSRACDARTHVRASIEAAPPPAGEGGEQPGHREKTRG